MSQASDDIKTYRRAAELNREDPYLRGSTLVFPNYGQLVVTGDLHGHRRNLERIVTYCDLEHAPGRHVVLHELLHEEPQSYTAYDMSHELLLEAARWKCEFPDSVHFLQSNHELAQLQNQGISKGGRIMTFNYVLGVQETYGSQAAEVVDAMLELLASYALAARTANRIMVSHSLPAPSAMSQFDPTVLDRVPTDEDLREGGSAYCLVWGRYQTAEMLADLAQTLEVDYFICGHQPQEEGYAVLHDKLLILACDHNHGVLLPLNLGNSYDMPGLVKALRPLASIA